MLGLAVGIDYALFILSRYRQNIDDGLEPREAAAQATGTAGSAVVFAGATVVIALVGLTVVNIPFLTVMGLAAAGAVIVAVLIATTLLPALLGFAGQAGRRGSTARSTWRPRGAGPDARDGQRALRALRDPPAAGPCWLVGLVVLIVVAPAGDAHEARPAGRRLEADRQHRAPRLRPADRGLRPRLQRRAHGRGRRAGPAARAAEAAGHRRGEGHRGRSRTWPPSRRRLRTSAAT